MLALPNNHSVPNFDIPRRRTDLFHNANAFMPETARSLPTMEDVGKADTPMRNPNCNLRRTELSGYWLADCDLARLGAMVDIQG